ncbi:MAG: hypothetical protein ACODAU_06790 [Myxococcota bacterium]
MTLRARARSARRLVSCLAAALALAGCGGAQTGPSEAAEDPLAPANLYPLAEGNVWSYNVRSAEDEPPTLEVRRVVSAEGARVEVESWGGERVVYELRPGGIYRPGFDVWLLKAPVRPGATWPSASGRTARVASVDVAVEVPAGRFTGCVRVEERGGDAELSVATIYCPGVGPVHVESGMRADLTGMRAHVVGKLLGYELEGASSVE